MLKRIVLASLLTTSISASGQSIRDFPFKSKSQKYYSADKRKLAWDLQLLDFIIENKVLQIAVVGDQAKYKLNFSYSVKRNQKDKLGCLEIGHLFTRVKYNLDLSMPKRAFALLQEYEADNPKQCENIKSLLDSIEWKHIEYPQNHPRGLRVHFLCRGRFLTGTLNLIHNPRL